jgi:hypothetical protein
VSFLRSDGLRNVAILLAIAAAVNFLPGGGSTADFVAALLFIAMSAIFVWIVARLYRENRVAIFSLGDQNRALLYGAIGIAVLAMAARNRLFDSGAGTLVWFAMIGAASFAVYRVWRSYREYA